MLELSSSIIEKLNLHSLTNPTNFGETKFILNSLTNWFVNHTFGDANFVPKWAPRNCFEGMIFISSLPKV